MLEGHQKESLGFNDTVTFVNFKVENEVLTPFVIPLVISQFYSDMSICEVKNTCEEFLSDQIYLRRSKRRLVQPERFLGHDLSDTDIGPIRIGTQKIGKWKDEPLPLALPNKDGTYDDFLGTHPEKGIQVDFLGISPTTDAPTLKRKGKRKNGNPLADVTEFAIFPHSSEDDGWPKFKGFMRDNNSSNNSKENGNFARNFFPRERQKLKKKKYYEDFAECDSRWDHLGKFRKGRRIKYYYMSRKRDYFYGRRVQPKRTMRTSGYYDVIKEYMKKIELTMNTEEPLVMDQWRDFHAENFGFGCKGRNEKSHTEDDEEEVEEITETEMLWRELDAAISSGCFDNNWVRLCTQVLCSLLT